MEKTDLFDPSKNSVSTIITLFNNLNKFEKAESSRKNIKEKNEYGYALFRTLFHRVTINTQWDDNVAKDIRDYFSGVNVSTYISDLVARESIHIITEDCNYSLAALKYILKFIDHETLVALLLFRLADINRSGKGTMKLDEHLVWYEALEKYTYHNSSLSDEQISRVCDFIRKSRASHYMSDAYIEWICKSLHCTINDSLYNEFKNNMVYGFSFASYAIFKLTMGDCYDFRSIPAMIKYKDVQTQLKTIEDILKQWDLDYILYSYG